jgi:hypothetical protein
MEKENASLADHNESSIFQIEHFSWKAKCDVAMDSGAFCVAAILSKIYIVDTNTNIMGRLMVSHQNL